MNVRWWLECEYCRGDGGGASWLLLQAASHADYRGMLPLHHAMREQWDAECVAMVVGAYPEAVQKKMGSSGGTPVELLRYDGSKAGEGMSEAQYLLACGIGE